MGGQARASTTQSLSFHLHRRRKTSLLPVRINSTKQDKQFLGCFTRLLALRRQTVSTPARWLRSFPISSKRPKIGSPS